MTNQKQKTQNFGNNMDAKQIATYVAGAITTIAALYFAFNRYKNELNALVEQAREMVETKPQTATAKHINVR